MATCTICHVTKEETFGWWGITTPSDQVTLCPRCFRLRSLNELLVRVNEVIMDAEIPAIHKTELMYEIDRIKNE